MSDKSAIRTYSAFISYRHAEEDTRVAKEVHRKLERYHLDRDVRKQTGMTSLAPIFRDEDELPISSALDDDLISALRNASALIVIASPRTNESKWVAREVDVFLETHDQSRVFVALCEGEPRDVVPLRLLKKAGPDGTMIDVEPLAANFRRECTGAARRNEVTRLAAGILGVPYDSLVKRAQRRRQRIVSLLAAAAVAASSAFGLYNSYMRTQIHANYVEALRRRSEYLATEANILMDEGNTLGATELALAALPDAADPQTAERPVVPEAVYALQQATNAGIAGTLADRSFTTSEVYVADSDLRKVSVSEDESYVTLIDETEVVSTWEVANHRLVFQERSSLGGFGAVIDAFALNSGATVVVYERGVVCRSGEDGSILWEYELESSAGAAVQAALVAEGNDRLLVVCKEQAVVLDLTSAAERLCEVSLRELGGLDQETQWATPMGGACSTGTTFAFGLSMGDEEGFSRCVVATIDARDGQVRICEAPGLYAFKVGLLADGSVLAVLGSDPDAPISDRGTVHSTDYIDTVDFTVTIACMDAESASVRWAVPLTVWEVGFDVGFAQLAGQDGSTSGVVMCWICDHVLYLDGASGEVLNSLECAASIVGGSLLVDGTSFMGIQADGSFFICTQESESVLAFRSIGGEAYYAKVMPSAKIFIIRHNVVYGYSGSVADASVVTTSVDTCRASWEFPAKDGFVTARIPDDANELRVT
ncbi:MAG: TIR domain-containing protein, partial [Coriobacteriales bacterium]|nr:TIR domain-containing protein [Coriobacteriales bacterium]